MATKQVDQIRIVEQYRKIEIQLRRVGLNRCMYVVVFSPVVTSGTMMLHMLSRNISLKISHLCTLCYYNEARLLYMNYLDP